MAIQTDFTTNSGEYRQNQYVKVFKVNCDKEKIIMTISHSNTKDDYSYEDIEIEIPFDLDGPNPIIQSYDYLKQYVYTVSTDI